MENGINSNEVTHDKLLKYYEDAESSTYDARTASNKARDYFDGKQWTSEEKKELNNRKQPALVKNRIKSKVNYLTGAEVQTRTDPRAYPRTPEHSEEAESVTDALRFVWDNADGDEIRSEVKEEQIVEGIGAAEVIGEKRGDDVEIVINHIPFDRFFYDPHSRKKDFSDARYKGIIAWMDFAVAKEKYSNKVDVIEATQDSGDSTDESYDDRPREQCWINASRKRVKVIQLYWQENGTWMVSHLTKGGYLIDPIESPYVDEYGKPDCPIEAVSAYVDRENNRYGVVADMISPQDEVNKRSSKALHLLNTRQARYDKNYMGNMTKEQIRAELAKPDGIIDAPREAFEILQTNDMAAGNLQLLQEAKMEMEVTGPNASMQGKQDGDQSGRAILAQQQGGMVEISRLLDSGRNWDRRMYRQIWNRIRQYWTEQKWIRVTDDDKGARFVGLNQPLTVRDEIEMELQNIPEGPERDFVQQELMKNDPQLDQVVGIRNEVARMDVDIIVQESPDMVNLQGEEFEQLSAMAAGGYPVPPQMIIETSSLSQDKKDQIIEQMGQPNPIAEAMQQIEIEGRAEEVRETQSKTLLNRAKAQSEAQPSI